MILMFNSSFLTFKTIIMWNIKYVPKLVGYGKGSTEPIFFTNGAAPQRVTQGT